MGLHKKAGEWLQDGPQGVLLMLCLSVLLHYVIFQNAPETEVVLEDSSGAWSAPVNVTFSTLTTQAQPEVEPPEPEPEIEPEPEPEPEEIPPEPVKEEPEILPEPEVVKEEAPVVKPVEKKPEPVEKPKVEEVKPEPPKKPEPEPEPQPPAEASVASALEEVKDVPEGLSEEIPVVTEPAFRSTPRPPSYPRMARRRNLEGVVLIEVLVDEAGNSQEIKIIESSGHEILDKAALRAVKKWEFKPMVRDGIATLSKVRVPVAFNLR